MISLSSIQKDPLDKSKISKKGRLAVIQDVNGDLQTIQEVTGNIDKDLLEPVFLNGELLKDLNFETVRANAVI